MELQNRKFVESLRSRRQEFDDLRKEIKDLWEMEERNYTNTCVLVKKARDNYWLKVSPLSVYLQAGKMQSFRKKLQSFRKKTKLLEKSCNKVLSFQI